MMVARPAIVRPRSPAALLRFRLPPDFASFTRALSTISGLAT
jgi:hypothetical protein